jgi:intein/homing endonuclease
MKVYIPQHLPDNAKIKLDKDAPNLFPNMKLAELSRLLDLNIKNLSRYKNMTRAIPIRLFEKLLAMSEINPSHFQGKIELKIEKTGDYLRIGPYLDINEDWIYISQLINGDGHITSNLWHINFVNNNQALIDHVYNFFRDLGLKDNHFYILKRPDATFLTIRCALLAVILNKILDVSVGKKEEIIIPEFVAKNKEFEIAAVRGAFDAEGCVSFSGTRRISITSNSKNWIVQLNKILDDLRIKSRIFKEEKNREKPIYALLINHIVNIKKFDEIIRPVHSKRKLKLKEIIKSFNKNYNGKFHKDILLVIKQGICRKRDIAKRLNLSLDTINNNLAVLKRKGFICPKEKFVTNKGGYFLYALTEKGEDFLKNESGSFFY